MLKSGTADEDQTNCKSEHCPKNLLIVWFFQNFQESLHEIIEDHGRYRSGRKIFF